MKRIVINNNQLEAINELSQNITAQTVTAAIPELERASSTNTTTPVTATIGDSSKATKNYTATPEEVKNGDVAQNIKDTDCTITITPENTGNTIAESVRYTKGQILEMKKRYINENYKTMTKQKLIETFFK